MRAPLALARLMLLALASGCEKGVLVSFSLGNIPDATTEIAVCALGGPADPAAPQQRPSGQRTLQVRLDAEFQGSLFFEARSPDGDCGVLASAQIALVASTAARGEAITLSFQRLGAGAPLCRLPLSVDAGGAGQGRLSLCAPESTDSCRDLASAVVAACPQSATERVYYVPRGVSVMLRATDGPSSHFGGWDSGGRCAGEGRSCVTTVEGNTIPALRGRFDLGTCLNEQLCWENPLPQGQDLNGAFVRGAEHFAVGDSGTVLRYGPERAPQGAPLRDGWTRLPVDDSEVVDLYGIAGTPGTPGDLWVVGQKGRLLHLDAERLAALPNTPQSNAALRGVSGALSGQVIAVGDRGTRVYGDRPQGTWQFRTQADAIIDDLSQVFALDPGGVYATAQSGKLVSGDPRIPQWQARPCAMTALSGIFGQDGGLWLTDLSGGIWRFDSQAGCQRRTTVPSTLRAIHGGTTARFFLVGDNGAILEGPGLQEVPPPLPGAALRAVHLDSSEAGLIAGAGGALLRYAQGQWQPEADAAGVTPSGLNAVAGGDRRGGILAVGDGGLLLRWDGARWQREASPDDRSRALRAVTVSATLAFAVGADGVVLQRDGAGPWRLDESAGSPPGDLRGAAQTANFLWVVGKRDREQRSVWRRSLSTGAWEPCPLPTEAKDLYAAWASGTQVCVAGQKNNAGTSNVLCSYGESPNVWVPQNTATGLVSVLALWGSGPSDLWAAGDGFILHRVSDDSDPRTANTWDPPEVIAATLYAGTSMGKQVMAAGREGALWRRDPDRRRWEPVTTSTRKTLLGAFAVRPGDFLFVGEKGSILRYIP